MEEKQIGVFFQFLSVSGYSNTHTPVAGYLVGWLATWLGWDLVPPANHGNRWGLVSPILQGKHWGEVPPLLG